MNKEEKKNKPSERNERINQFIIECLFNKYFEEKKNDKIEIKKEEVRV